MRDKQGRTYARLIDVRGGDKVVVDGDFICLPPWSTHEVRQHVNGGLYIECSSRIRHFLEDQPTRGGYLLGIYPEGTKTHVQL